MGWFWADPAPVAAQKPTGHPPVAEGKAPPPGCPMHDKTIDGLSGKKPEAPKTTASACPVPHDAPPASGCPVPHDQRGQAMEKADIEPSKSILSQLNPLNYMFPDLSNAKAADQTHHLPTTREPSTIPRGSGEGNWEYPSPQQMYNALLRKGYTDTDVTAVESMVSVHNFLNEGAWDEIVGWERRFSRGLMSGYNTCRRGEQNTEEMLEQTNGYVDGIKAPEPTLIRFQGRPKDMTPKATMMQVMGWLYPSKFGTEPPFDRHDWFVSRKVNGEEKQIRYVIDYYSGEPEADGLPVFYLDVRPAATPLGTAERAIRWGTDVWWRAIGGDKRENDPTPMINPNVSRIWKSS